MLYLEGLKKDQGCLCGVMACEWDILPQRLREGIAVFFDAHLGWLEQILKSGIENGTIRQGVDVVSRAKLVLSTLEGMLLLGRIFDKQRGFEATIAALIKFLR